MREQAYRRKRHKAATAASFRNFIVEPRFQGGCVLFLLYYEIERMRKGGGREEAASGRFYIHKEPRFRSEKSAADAKLERISLSAGGFLRVPMDIEAVAGRVTGGP